MTDETKETTAEIFGRVAPFLGEGWTARVADPDYPSMGGYLDHVDGASLHAYGGYRPGRTDRLAISGMYPGDYQTRGRVPSCEITVAKNRPPKAIAAEITRRLLPDYLVELAKVREQMAAAEVAAGQQAAAIAKLVEIFPLATPQDNGVRWYTSGDFVSYGDVDLYHDGSKGKLEIRSVSFDTLARIFQALAAAREDEMIAEQVAAERRAHTED